MMDDERDMRTNGYCDHCGMIGGHTEKCYMMKPHLIIELHVNTTPESQYQFGQLLEYVGQHLSHSGYDGLPKIFKDVDDVCVGTITKVGKW